MIIVGLENSLISWNFRGDFWRDGPNPQFWFLGVELEEIGLDPFSIYPNPVESFVLVNSNTSIGANELVVYDITGNVVCRSVNKSIEKNEPLRIDAEKLKPGVYLLNFTSESGSKWTKRFIKK